MSTTPLSRKQSSLDFPLIALVILVTALALLWGLGTSSLAPWDEAIYAQVSKEMAQSGDWLTPHWKYQLWFEKPPLFMWITALFYRFFAINEFWARAPSALSGITLAGLTYAIGKIASGKRVGVLAAVILLTCYHFLSFSRFGTMEVMLTLFAYLALYAYLQSRSENERWWYLVWSSCALALMVKGAGGLIAPATIVLALASDGQFGAATRSRHFWFSILLALLIVLPWHILMYVWYGRAFLSEYLGYHVIARATMTLEGHASSPFYFLARLIDGFFPWCLAVPFAVISATKRNRNDRSRSWVLLLISLLVLGLYTVIPTRRPWYILPVYPALAVLLADFISRLQTPYQSSPTRARLVTATYVVFIIVGGLYSFLSLYFNYKPEEPVANLARLAQSTTTDDRDALVILSGVEPIAAQVPLFYSNRPVEQAYMAVKPATEDAPRYVYFQNLAELTQSSAKRIILSKEDVQRLSLVYDVKVEAENGSLAYATIRHKRVNPVPTRVGF